MCENTQLYYNIPTQLVAFIKKLIYALPPPPLSFCNQFLGALGGQPISFLTTHTEIYNDFYSFICADPELEEFPDWLFTAADINPHIPRVSSSGVLTGDCALIGKLGHKQNSRVLYPCLRSAGIYIDWRIIPPPSLGF